jgi:hypothetical protein
MRSTLNLSTGMQRARSRLRLSTRQSKQRVRPSIGAYSEQFWQSPRVLSAARLSRVYSVLVFIRTILLIPQGFSIDATKNIHQCPANRSSVPANARVPVLGNVLASSRPVVGWIGECTGTALAVGTLPQNVLLWSLKGCSCLPSGFSGVNHTQHCSDLRKGHFPLMAGHIPNCLESGNYVFRVFRAKPVAVNSHRSSCRCCSP